jgi:NAD(P)-dependent dehydrogenase (short-subunit alcohol dehydrogenase family)
VTVLEGHVVVVTGAARGLGRAYCLDAAREGAAVVVNDIDPAAVDVAAEIVAAGGRAHAIVESVATWDGAGLIVSTALDVFGRIDGLVNNAGVLRTGDPWDETESRLRESLDVNVLGSMFVGTHAIRAMKAGGGGSIVNNCSSGHLGAPGRAAYAAAKGALASLTYAWAIDLAPVGIRVNAFSSVAATPMSQQSPAAALGLPSPEANAPLVTYLLSDAAADITGQVIQRYQDGFMILSHPDFTEHFAAVGDESVRGVVEAFDPVLRANAQRVGWYGPNGRDFISTGRPLDSRVGRGIA